MILNITTWANEDRTKKVVRTSVGLQTYYSIHTLTDDFNNVSLDEANEYLNKEDLKRIDTITLDFPVTI